MKYSYCMIVRHVFLLIVILNWRVCLGQESRRLLHVGITLPLTGPAAAYGMAARNGFELARKHNLGIRNHLFFNYEDTQLKPALAVNAFSSLQQRHKNAIHFDFGSATSLALAPIAEQRRVLLVSSAYDSAVSRNRDFVYRFTNSTADYAAVMASELRRRGVREVAVVVADNPFFTEFADTLKAAMADYEQFAIHLVKADESDFGAVALKLRNGNSSLRGLGIFLFVEQASQLLRKMNATGIVGFMFATDALEEITPQHPDAQLFEGIQFPNAKVTSEFIEMYRNDYGTIAHSTFAASTYDFANMLEQVFRQCQLCGSEELQKALEAPLARHGALGEYRFINSPEAGKHFASDIVMKAVLPRDAITRAASMK
ncbi:MAG: ABC transporter substrate-binding protein [Pseudomonadota bacterium]|jgi:branched-chain amino acid transport system substrate-binding protein